MVRTIAGAALGLLVLAAAPARGQYEPGKQGSSNMKVLAHVPLGGAQPLPGGPTEALKALGRRTADITMEQELSRPYVYVCHRFAPTGFYIINIKDPAKAKVMYHWEIENADLHRGPGALGPMYAKSRGRYYYLQTFQFQQGGPNVDLGAIVFDVTGLPDTSKIREVGRIRAPDAPGGFHENFTYKHSSGASLMFATSTRPYASIYDIDKFVAGDQQQGLVGRIPIPDTIAAAAVVGRSPTYHDFYVGFDPASQQDRYYGAGSGGYYVFDVTDLANPRLLTSLTGISGVGQGHTFTPTPDGRYAVTEVEYKLSPLRIFDLKPGLDGTVKTISRPIGAWTANWKNFTHNMEVRWPYVFTGSFDDGVHVFNMMDPTNPYTVAYYDTWDGPDMKIGEPDTHMIGAWGPQIRNADGLIVAADFTTGFWAFRMDGFDGWNGHQWGMPNNSSAQDWDNGPDGVQRKKVS